MHRKSRPSYQKQRTLRFKPLKDLWQKIPEDKDKSLSRGTVTDKKIILRIKKRQPFMVQATHPLKESGLQKQKTSCPASESQTLHQKRSDSLLSVTHPVITGSQISVPVPRTRSRPNTYSVGKSPVISFQKTFDNRKLSAVKKIAPKPTSEEQTQIPKNPTIVQISMPGSAMLPKSDQFAVPKWRPIKCKDVKGTENKQETFPKGYVCDHKDCYVVEESAFNLKRHLFSHGKEWLCSLCSSKPFYSENSFKFHLRDVHGKACGPVLTAKLYTFMCELCSFQCSLGEDLSSHMQVYHNIVMDDGKLLYCCNKCSFLAESRSELSAHREKHLTCVHCGSRFPNFIATSRHMKEHPSKKQQEWLEKTIKKNKEERLVSHMWKLQECIRKKKSVVAQDLMDEIQRELSQEKAKMQTSSTEYTKRKSPPEKTSDGPKDYLRDVVGSQVVPFVKNRKRRYDTRYGGEKTSRCCKLCSGHKRSKESSNYSHLHDHNYSNPELGDSDQPDRTDMIMFRKMLWKQLDGFVDQFLIGNQNIPSVKEVSNRQCDQNENTIVRKNTENVLEHFQGQTVEEERDKLSEITIKKEVDDDYEAESQNQYNLREGMEENETCNTIFNNRGFQKGLGDMGMNPNNNLVYNEQEGEINCPKQNLHGDTVVSYHAECFGTTTQGIKIGAKTHTWNIGNCESHQYSLNSHDIPVKMDIDDATESKQLNSSSLTNHYHLPNHCNNKYITDATPENCEDEWIVVKNPDWSDDES